MSLHLKNDTSELSHNDFPRYAWYCFTEKYCKNIHILEINTTLTWPWLIACSLLSSKQWTRSTLLRSWQHPKMVSFPIHHHLKMNLRNDWILMCWCWFSCLANDILNDEYPNYQKAEPRFGSTLRWRLGRLAIQHLVSNQIYGQMVQLAGVVFTWSCFYKDAEAPANAFYLVLTDTSCNNCHADFIFKRFINRCTQPDVHSVTCSSLQFLKLLQLRSMSYPNHLLRWRSRLQITSIVVSKKWRVNGYWAASITRSSPLPTPIPIGAFPLFSITVFTSAKSRLINQDLWSSQWSLTLDGICFTRSFRNISCLQFQATLK